MDNKNKTYTNLSIAGILFLMTGYLLEKIIDRNGNNTDGVLYDFNNTFTYIYT